MLLRPLRIHITVRTGDSESGNETFKTTTINNVYNDNITVISLDYAYLLGLYTTGLAATSIKRDPRLSGHFCTPKRFLMQTHLY